MATGAGKDGTSFFHITTNPGFHGFAGRENSLPVHAFTQTNDFGFRKFAGRKWCRSGCHWMQQNQKDYDRYAEH
jgi:hypothetical protein